MNSSLYDAIAKRRSVYSIDNQQIVSIKRIEELVQHAIYHCPTPYNSHSGVAIVLFEQQHQKLWDLIASVLIERIASEKHEATKKKLADFQAGYGTVLFFEDTAITEGLQSKFPSYKDTFPIWVTQAQGMLQYMVWTSLEAEGLGASLQHYNPLIDEQVQKTWNIPSTWKLAAQMPFGRPVKAPKEKVFPVLEEKYRSHR